jgi:phage terminase small subunit
VADDDLTARQDRAILALLTTETKKAAARKAGVPESTLYSWLDLPAFQRRLRRARNRIWDESVTGVVRASNDAVKALKKNLKAKEPQVQVRAAKVLLDHGARMAAMADLQAQIDELREQMATPHADPQQPEPGTGEHPPGGGGAGPADEPDARPATGRPRPAVQGDGVAPGPLAGAVPLFDE